MACWHDLAMTHARPTFAREMLWLWSWFSRLLCPSNEIALELSLQYTFLVFYLAQIIKNIWVSLICWQLTRNLQIYPVNSVKKTKLRGIIFGMNILENLHNTILKFMNRAFIIVGMFASCIPHIPFFSTLYHCRLAVVVSSYTIV